MSGRVELTSAHEQLLAALDPYRAQIERNLAERERLYVERADLFLTIRENAPELPLSQLARRAGVSVPAVIQQIDKARERRGETG